MTLAQARAEMERTLIHDFCVNVGLQIARFAGRHEDDPRSRELREIADRLGVRPRALDLFCGAGGASMGLHRAGFDVVGVDIKRQPRYPFPFIQGDALRTPVDLGAFDFIWASPPCQPFTALNATVSGLRDRYPDLIEPVRALLRESGALYAIENVPGAPLRNPAKLCGSLFALKVRRHRLLETNFGAAARRCRHERGEHPIGVHGTGGRRVRRRANDRGGNTHMARNLAEARAAMGIGWMSRAELSQAVPPAYAEFIGRAAMAIIKGRQAA